MQADAKEGGTFEIFGGSVIGKYTSVKQDKEILLDWRFRNWQESDISKVLIHPQHMRTSDNAPFSD